MLVARETAVLSREDRADVDRELAPKLAGWGDRRVEGEARKAAYRLDPHAAVAASPGRRVGAARRASGPCPDTMVRLSAVLPVAQGVACYAALCRAADTAAGGDGRGRGQFMADTMVERLTGQSAAADVPVEVELLMSDETLLGGHRAGAASRLRSDPGRHRARNSPRRRRCTRESDSAAVPGAGHR